MSSLFRNLGSGVPWLLVGLMAGWLLRENWSTATTSHEAPRSEIGQVDEREGGLQATPAIPTPKSEVTFESLLADALVSSSSGDFERAMETLLQLSQYLESPQQRDRFELQMSRIVDAYTRELVGRNRYDRIDTLYERLTLALPDFAEYHLLLGQLRIQTGNEGAALPPLAHISNHEKLGAEARRLIEQIESGGAADTPAAAEVALLGHGNQFVVEALLDERYPVKLLIDTGAAVTAIDAAALARAGYDLNSERQYFVTANGVVSAPVVVVQRLAIGGVWRENVPVGALDLNIPRDVVGLLGMNFLRHYRFNIDQDRRLLILDER